MRIALVQLSAAEDRAGNVDRALAAIGHAAGLGADLVAFPELAVDRFFPQAPDDPVASRVAEFVPGPTSDRVSGAAAEHGVVVVFNLYERAADGRCYDSSPVFDADGSMLGVTRMAHITEYACFHEQQYYSEGEGDAPVYDTAAGRVGVAICYDRHYPEYMRRLGEHDAQLVVIPQAGSVGEWPDGLFEAEVRVAAFQNGYFAALCNRVGAETHLTFAGESFVASPEGEVIARAAAGREDVLLVDLDLAACDRSTARRLFWRDRRPDLYARWNAPENEASPARG